MHSDPADARPAPPRQEIYTKKPAASRLPVIALIALGAVIAFGTSIWYAYQYGVNQQVRGGRFQFCQSAAHSAPDAWGYAYPVYLCGSRPPDSMGKRRAGDFFIGVRSLLRV